MSGPAKSIASQQKSDRAVAAEIIQTDPQTTDSTESDDVSVAAAAEVSERSEDQPAANSLRGALREVGRHMREVRGLMALALGLLVLGSLVGLGQPLATQWVLGALGSGGSLAKPVLMLCIFVLGSAAAQGIGQFLMLRVSEDVVAGARRGMIRQLLGMSVSAMAARQPGELMSRVISDSSSVRQIAMQSVVQSITGTVVVVGSIVLMVLLDWFLFLVTFGVVVGLCLLLTLIMPKIRQASQQTQRTVGEMSSELERVLGSFTTVKAAVAQDTEEERITSKVNSARASGIRGAGWTAMSGMTSALTVQAAFLVVLGVGGLRVQSGEMTIPILVAFLLYAMQLSAPVLQLTTAVSSFQAGRAAIERIAETETFEQEDDFEVEDLPAEAVPGSGENLGALSWEPIAAHLDDVVFTYPDEDHPTLNGVTIEIPSQGLTALVGPSGSGKSTILRLIEGFYPIERGRIHVANRVLGDWDLEQLRTDVAFVEQETPVLAGTVADNLTYGVDEEVSVDHIREVVEQVSLDKRINSLSEKVGHRGGAMSGGERQRISIARALLRQPKMLLLDEVTSQLDPRTEKEMMGLINEIAERIPVIMVAHRLSTVVGAHRIVVLETGQVRAVGTHRELLESDPLYHEMVEQQGLLDAAQAR